MTTSAASSDPGTADSIGAPAGSMPGGETAFDVAPTHAEAAAPDGSAAAEPATADPTEPESRASFAAGEVEADRRASEGSGEDEDPTPIPIAWYNLWEWALKTGKAERRFHGKLHRRRRLTSKTLAAAIRPNLDRPIFVLGAARTGTTFLGDCLGYLPEVSYHHEPPATKAAGRYVYEGIWGFRRSRWFYRSVYAWLMRVDLEGHLRMCEKTPTNALLIPFLDEAFEGAQVVHIIRDGRDAAASHIRKAWLRADARGSGKREPGGYLYGPWAPWWVERGRREEFETTSDVHRVIWAWRRYTEAALRDGPILGPDRYIELRYENLVSNPRAEGKRLVDFLGIRRPASQAALFEALERAEPGSVGSWRRSFDEDQLAEIEADSGDLLRKLGYTDS